MILVLKTSFKAALLSSILFYFLEIKENIGLLFIVYTILFILSFMMILFTIFPIYLYGKNKHLTKSEIFKVFFPFYSIIFFAVCFCLLFVFNFSNTFLSICITAFITAIQSWVWFFNPN